jgi:hypothetical protein
MSDALPFYLPLFVSNIVDRGLSQGKSTTFNAFEEELKGVEREILPRGEPYITFHLKQLSSYRHSCGALRKFTWKLGNNEWDCERGLYCTVSSRNNAPCTIDLPTALVNS